MRLCVVRALCVTVLCMWAGSAQAAKGPVTNIHKAIVQETEWLNVSRPLTAEDLRGRILLIDFWTFCCINCMHVIPDLHYLEKKFGGKLTVIGVHSAKFANERDQENIRNAVLRYGIEHPVVNDAGFRIWKSFGVQAWPTLLLINPKGGIEEVYSGEGHREDLERDIAGLIEEYEKELSMDPLPFAPEAIKASPSALQFPGKFIYEKDIEGAPAFFVSDSGNNRVLGVRSSGDIFLSIGGDKAGFLDGDFKRAAFYNPQGLLYRDGMLYVADTGNHALRKIDFREKRVSTIAGTGEQAYDRRVSDKDALKTKLASPWDLAFYPSDAFIAIAMAGTHQLWTYDIKNGTVSVLAGNGRESIDDGRYPYNSLSQPSGLAVYDEKLYFVDSETSSLRVLENGEISTLIGTGLFDFGLADGPQGKGLMQHPLGVYADATGVYVADSYNHAIRHYDPKTGVLSTISGDGKRGPLNEPNDILRVNGALYVLDTNNHAIRVLWNDAITTLEVMYPGVAPVLSPAGDFPNLLPSEPLDVKAGWPVMGAVGLPDGWKINAEAPSRLSLFTAAGKHLASYETKALAALRVALPELAANQEYVLQGTLYYCEDRVGALCLIQSVHQEIRSNAKGGQEAFTLPMRIPTR